MKMGRRGIALILFGLLVYLVGLLVHLPAAHAWRWFGGQVPVEAFGLSGKLWSGQAAVVLHQNLRLDGVSWDLAPRHLLTGRLGGEVRATASGGELRARGSANRHSADVQMLRADLPVGEVLRWVNSPLIPAEVVEGRLQAQLSELSVRDGVIRQLAGVVDWREARLRMGSGLNLGNLSLRLQPTEQGSRGEIRNSDSPLEIQGALNLGREGDFTLSLDLRPTDAASRQALSVLGPGEEGETRTVRVRGRMTPEGVQLEPLNRG
ncbi:type II secretion system protein N [Alkalilimnicola sp. S0819]|uniref:type II secretion system protein N n=1 Tax=Alkalilimnicola sp. S0819 TaxID=2613922 RepID=UPI001261AF6F|nr:type II secretion system protein N [Alkalilimnicola sp. S0819]KAB7622986.1 type II secretion system protein N [Alkalilimnicola sp. S0819]MPQ17096.1 hypothetical protein [Alkalilimnicola sp. S0819]